jgi:hypothetical protein
MAKDFAEATDARAGTGLSGLRSGVVSSVLASGCVMVAMNGGVVGPYATLTSYTGAVGDTVAMMRQDSTWLVLGKVRTC